MVTPEELKSACEIIIRLIVDDDEKWDKVPSELKEGILGDIIKEAPNLIPELQRKSLQVLISLIVYMEDLTCEEKT